MEIKIENWIDEMVYENGFIRLENVEGCKFEDEDCLVEMVKVGKNYVVRIEENWRGEIKVKWINKDEKDMNKFVIELFNYLFGEG